MPLTQTHHCEIIRTVVVCTLAVAHIIFLTGNILQHWGSSLLEHCCPMPNEAIMHLHGIHHPPYTKTTVLQ